MSFLSEPISIQSIFGPKRKIGSIDLQVVIQESTTDALTITKQPVQVGAAITDHSFNEPTGFSITAYFKDQDLFSPFLSPFANSGLAKIYKELLDLQSSRVPFSVITPKRVYNSMLMSSLSQTTDRQTENCLSISASFQEIILVNIGVTTVPRILQSNPGKTGATEQAGKKSAFLTGYEGVKGFVGSFRK